MDTDLIHKLQVPNSYFYNLRFTWHEPEFPFHWAGRKFNISYSWSCLSQIGWRVGDGIGRASQARPPHLLHCVRSIRIFAVAQKPGTRAPFPERGCRCSLWPGDIALGKNSCSISFSFSPVPVEKFWLPLRRDFSYKIHLTSRLNRKPSTYGKSTHV